MALLDGLLADLDAEGAALDAVVAGLDDPGWATPTPAAGWTVAHQVAHLAWTDEVALLAATDPDPQLPDLSVDAAAAEGAAVPPAELLARWRASRRSLAEALRAVPAGAKLPWYGPPMGAASMATARLMETWAHGVDVTDALGLPVSATDRLRAVAHLGVVTRGFAFGQHGLPAPADDVRVELTAPSGEGEGEGWTWGDAAATDRVAGPALDFCLRVTQRRPRTALALTATGPVADRWLDVAQAFAGRPGAGSGRTA
ncbi:TIGR03084 family metal-binding protein [Klenkia sp. PcliD-1-E]|uniref:TIGR03084 family metal-binding protein n=1 Tax=Klenkia sp. PcliD-1-E TaxID=2954492 RepID=UPI00209731F4|nr:TIGR03084 family metal-binding protein [Klenkia sp. PcliD-1-E]MCO7218267.1 TIGR03084 family metal-binding protein [Klenkia sp. PcliD-1-E]